MTVDNRSVGMTTGANRRKQRPSMFRRAEVVGMLILRKRRLPLSKARPSKCSWAFLLSSPVRTGRVRSGVEWPATKKAPAGFTPHLQADGTVREVSMKTLVSWQRDKASIEANRGLMGNLAPGDKYKLGCGVRMATCHLLEKLCANNNIGKP